MADEGIENITNTNEEPTPGAEQRGEIEHSLPTPGAEQDGEISTEEAAAGKDGDAGEDIVDAKQEDAHGESDDPAPPNPSSETGVNLSQLKFKYNSHSQSNLRNVLTDYGLPDQRQSGPTKEKQKKKKDPKPAKKVPESTWSEGDAEKARLKQEHYMQVYNDIYRLRDLFYEEYTYQLRTKIDKQKEDIKKRDRKSEQLVRQKQEKDRLEAQNLKKRMLRHDFVHDDSFLQGVPKTQYYKIVALMDRMKLHGQLRTQTQIDDFWRNIRRPEVFLEYFPPSEVNVSQTMSTNDAISMVQRSHTSGSADMVKSIPSPQHQHTTSTSDGQRPLTQITEVNEISRPASRRNEWAITQQASHVHKQATSRRRPDPATVAKQAAVELDKAFPAMELPKLHCFTDLDLGEKTQDPQEILKQIDLKRREKERHSYVKKLRQMYQLALSNTASSQRIIDNKISQQTFDLEPSVKELTAVFGLAPLVKESADKTPEYPWAKYLTRPAILPIAEVPEENSSRGYMATDAIQNGGPSSSHTRRTISKTRRSPTKTPVSLPPPPHLTLSSLQTTTKVVEAKGASTMWTNYMRSGTSLTAES